MATAKKGLSNLQLVELVDSWPHYVKDPAAYRVHMENFYFFEVTGYSHPLGHIFKPFVDRFPWSSSPYWTVDHARRTVTLTTPPDADSALRTALINSALRAACTPDSPVKPMRRWHDERVSVWYHHQTPSSSSASRTHVMDIDRCGAEFIAFPSYGVHMTGWITTPSGEMRIWVPRRAATKSTYPNKLDNTVGGSLRASESPLDCIVREADEELCLPEEYTRARVRAVGTLSSHTWAPDVDPDAPAYERQVQYVYELEMDSDVIPRVGDGEVGEVSLMSVDEVRQRLAAGEFKLNTILTYLAFFIRHGIITAENEPEFVEICNRLHRPYDIFRL